MKVELKNWGEQSESGVGIADVLLFFFLLTTELPPIQNPTKPPAQLTGLCLFAGDGDTKQDCPGVSCVSCRNCDRDENSIALSTTNWAGDFHFLKIWHLIFFRTKSLCIKYGIGIFKVKKTDRIIWILDWGTSSKMDILGSIMKKMEKPPAMGEKERQMRKGNY